MTGFGLIVVLIIAIIVMILAISKLKIHPFLAILAVSLLFGLVAGIPLINRSVDGKTTDGIATVIGLGFSGTFTSIGIVIILGALIGMVIEATGAAFKLADMVIKFIKPELKKQDTDSFKDYKTALQELVQKKPDCKIVYELVSEEGAAHEKTFVANVIINGNIEGSGSGNSKKKAQQQAARAALIKFTQCV